MELKENSLHEEAKLVVDNLHYCINDEYDFCEKCRYQPSPVCVDSLMIDAMDMLWKLLGENEDLKAENKVFQNANKGLEEDLIELESLLDEANDRIEELEEDLACS